VEDFVLGGGDHEAFVFREGSVGEAAGLDGADGVEECDRRDDEAEEEGEEAGADGSKN
jgi:hypothetical protein